jgi:hypothetical protein
VEFKVSLFSYFLERQNVIVSNTKKFREMPGQIELNFLSLGNKPLPKNEFPFVPQDPGTWAINHMVGASRVQHGLIEKIFLLIL